VQFWENAVKVFTLYMTFCEYWAYLCNIYPVTFGSTCRLQIFIFSTFAICCRPSVCLSVCHL